MPRQPLIAVSATIRDEAGVPRVRLTAAYLYVLERVGLVPVVVAPAVEGDPATAAARVLNAVNGLVLTGGEDVDPAYYGAAPSPQLHSVSATRDAIELALVRSARDRALPTLAICRGIQLLNVALGGTLVQDIPTERPGALAHDPSAARDQRTHAIVVEPRSRIAHALGATAAQVNSVHHQAVDRVANGLRVTARAPDGIIEGVEGPAGDRWWVVGVQWHPEEFVADIAASDHGLFRAFAAEVGVGVGVGSDASATRRGANASSRAPAASAGRGNGRSGRGTHR